MDCEELIWKIKEEVPGKTKDIITGLQLFSGLLNETQEVIWEKVERFRKDKDFTSIRYYINLAEEVETFNNKTNAILETFQNESNEMEEDRASDIAKEEYSKEILEKEVLNQDEDEDSDIEDDSDIDLNEKKSERKDFLLPEASEQKVPFNTQIKSPSTEPGHSLYENFTHKKPYGFKVKNNQIIRVDSWQDMLAKTCELLLELDEKKFMGLEHNTRVNGRKQKYFSSDPALMTKRAKLIGDKMYVEVNQGANIIRNTITKLIKEFNIGISEYRVFFIYDFTGMSLK